MSTMESRATHLPQKSRSPGATRYATGTYDTIRHMWPTEKETSTLVHHKLRTCGQGTAAPMRESSTVLSQGARSSNPGVPGAPTGWPPLHSGAREPLPPFGICDKVRCFHVFLKKNCRFFHFSFLRKIVFFVFPYFFNFSSFSFYFFSSAPPWAPS